VAVNSSRLCRVR